MNKRKLTLVALTLIATLAVVGTVYAAVIDPLNRTVTTTQFFLDWHATDPEEIVNLQWNGSPNLTRVGSRPACPDDLEYFGNSWVSQDEGTPNFVFRSLVGWGSTGNWNAQGSHNVQIDSSSAGCPGSANVAVKTEYHFFDNGASANKFRVRRVFNFGNTAFPYNFRPYIPRLYPRTSYSQVLHPNAAGNALLTENSTPCDFGCQVSDWNQTWFAIHDPATGKGMIVKHKSSTPAVLWVDQDETSDTAASSVLLLQPRRGFTRRIVEKEDFCFYDRILWTPSLRLPRGC